MIKDYQTLIRGAEKNQFFGSIELHFVNGRVSSVKRVETFKTEKESDRDPRK